MVPDWASAMEKFTPTYDLTSIRAEFSAVDGLRMTVSVETARLPSASRSKVSSR
jgi:hypothetical protein